MLLTRENVVRRIIYGRSRVPQERLSTVFAPTNIALVKYWGKRDQELNLPNTPSLSITLGCKGAYTTLCPLNNDYDQIVINGSELPVDGQVARKFSEFFDLLRPDPKMRYYVKMLINIPIAAGLASSACSFASLVKAFDKLYGWNLSLREMSILARLGSGSACRSFWPGFVKWQMGERDDSMDSHGVPLDLDWPELRIGLCIVSKEKKIISSREAMQRTVATSRLYKEWPDIVAKDMVAMETALAKKDFALMGETAESNAIAMHRTMQYADPSVNYNLPASLDAMQKVRQLRKEGVGIYFSQDAGPNLKLLFLASEQKTIEKEFADLEIIVPFANPEQRQVVLVDGDDRSLGACEKIAAHENGGQLHRAFSVFLVRRGESGCEVLLQKRSHDKYHCGGLWTNSCCSHPQPGDDVLTAAHRRLREELNIATDLYLVDSFIYGASFGNGLTEREFDYVLVGKLRQSEIDFNRDEAETVKWVELEALKRDLVFNAHRYTPWFAQALSVAEKSIVELFC